MCQTVISVWFVCKLCRGGCFGQVDAFIEHKKQNHFNQFQSISCIVFEEREQSHRHLNITINGDPQIADKINEPQIKIEVNGEDPIIPFSSEIIEEPILGLLELQSELIAYTSEINPDSENSFFGLEQPEKNPYLLLKRLTSEEIQNACVPQQQHHSSLLKCKPKTFTNTHGFEPHNSWDAGSKSCDHNEVEKTTENLRTSPVIHFPKERDQHFECKLCSKQLPSDGHLKIHVGICALYHEDRNRFCVICNRKLSNTKGLKGHRLRFHGTEEEKCSLYKFKCHVCPRQYRQARDLGLHLATHKQKKQKKSQKLKIKTL